MVGTILDIMSNVAVGGQGILKEWNVPLKLSQVTRPFAVVKEMDLQLC